MDDFSIGVDLGGTNLRAAAIDRKGHLLDKVSGSTNPALGRDAVLDDMVSSIVTLREKLKVTHRLAGVGIGVPGFIDMEQGMIIGSNNLPGFDQFPVRDAIEQKLGTPVILENDANVAALGEKWMGAGQSVDHLVLLTLGTGIGGGIIHQGQIMHGFVGMAGELGHMTVVPNGNPCGCGNFGCLEKHASATAITAMARLLSLGNNLTSEQIYQLAIDGDEKAKSIFVSVGSALGIALANLINIFNFPLYLLSGGVLAGWELFAPSMMAEIEKRSFTFRHTKTRIERATLGGEAGLYGAAFLPFEKRFSNV